MSKLKLTLIFLAFLPSAQLLCEETDCDCSPIGCFSDQNYAPDDPWQKSRFWLRQTGHFGKFYNCDCEEAKRFSPCICWKSAAGRNFGWRAGDWLRRDLRHIKQRILDGSVCCNGKRNRRTPSESCHCNQSCTSNVETSMTFSGTTLADFKLEETKRSKHEPNREGNQPSLAESKNLRWVR